MPTVIAETDDLLVLNKPAGLIVHSDGRTAEPSVAAWLIERYPELEKAGEAWVSPQGERVPLAGIVHRLDRTTSGVLLVAKSPAMHAYLKNEFKTRRVEKTYLAYVYGHMEAREAGSNSSRQGRIVAEVMRSSEPAARSATTLGFSTAGVPAKKISAPRRWYARACDENDKRAAITDWKLLKQLEEAAYLEVRPRTGRTHQIRVHLASIGHPIVGDHLYAADRAPILGFARPALHASTISFTSPSGETIAFTAPLPPDFEHVSSK